MVSTQEEHNSPSNLRGWAPALQRKEALLRLTAQLAANPESVDLRFERACLLAELGENERSKQEYLNVLARCPSHAGALNNLGTLLYSTGHRTAARTAYREAVRQHPDQPMAHVNLGNLSLETGDLTEARIHYETALALDSQFAPAHRGLGNLLAELGEEEAAVRHHRLGGFDRHATELPYRGEASPVSILMLVSGRRGDVPVRHLLDDKTFQTFVALPNVYDPNAPLDCHQLVFNAIGDADICRQALIGAAALVERTDVPVINRPSAVLKTGRVANARRLSRLPGVVAPAIATLSREILGGPDSGNVLERSGLRFPLLLRAPGFHNGRHFRLVECESDLAPALAELPGDELTAIQFLDARGSDGQYRKYRVMMIAGQLYPLHLAISSHWKIHYVTANMAECAEHRAEEARFLDNMSGALGSRAMEGLASIQQTLGLDYAGIDFGLSANGEVLLFEANATMTVLPPDRDSRWDYRRAAVARIEEAVRKMLIERASSYGETRSMA